MKVNPFEYLKFTFDEDGYFQSCFVPRRIEDCPCCGSRLVVNCEQWVEEEISPNGQTQTVWMPDQIKVDCIRDMKCFLEYENSPMWKMPYVYWLPVEERCKAWLDRMIRIYYGLEPVPLKWLEANGQQNLFMKQGEIA